MEDRMRLVEERGGGGSSRSVFSVLRRRLWVAVLAGLAVLIAGGLYIVSQPRLYEASAWLTISGAGGPTPSRSQPTPQMFLTEADLWRSLGSESFLHIQMIRRYELARRVQEQLRLAATPGALLQRLNVRKVEGATSANLLAISFRWEVPEEAQKVVNTWARLYEQEALERNNRSVATGIAYVQKQLQALEKTLRQAEGRMARLQEQYLRQGLSLSDPSQAGRLGDLLKAFGDNQAELQATRAQIAQMQALLAHEPPEIKQVQETPSPETQALQERLKMLYAELEKKRQDYYEDSPEVTALRSEIARLERDLKKRGRQETTGVTRAANPIYQNARTALLQLYGQYKAQQARGQALARQLAQQQALLGRTPAGFVAFNELRRQVEGLQGVYSTLLQRLYELEMQQATTLSPVQVVRAADRPSAPVSPQYRSLILLTLLAALCLAVLAALVVDQIDDTFADLEEIRTLLGLPLLGMLPDAPAEEITRLLQADPGEGNRSAFASAVRMLASTLRIEMKRNGQRSLVVTSTEPGEGKTIVAANLAAALARSGMRVLLIDGDMHRPRLHEVLGRGKGQGLSNLLVEEREPADFLQETEVPGLQVLLAGPPPPSPVDLLSHARGQEIIERLNQLAEVVIWDMPPAGFLADATVVGHKADGIIFVVGKQARRTLARQTINNLRDLGLSVIGLCANRMRPVGRSAYYYYYYYSDDGTKRRRRRTQAQEREKA